jgi:hypothetical protein
MFESFEYVVGLIAPGDRVLDVGGWAEVFPRANVVLDANPYATRKIVHPDIAEHFTDASWFRGDICTADAWARFQDKEFDVTVCSHTLEDVRDPLFVCRQLIRVSKAGYIEVPSPFRETCKIDPGDSYAGYDHHRWIVDTDSSGRLVFTPKLSWANDFDPAGDRARTALRDQRFGFLSLTWRDGFSYYERMVKGSVLETENLYHFYDTFDYSQVPPYRRVLTKHEESAATWVWADDYLLPVEQLHSHEYLITRYRARRPTTIRSRTRDNAWRALRWLRRGGTIRHAR